MNNNLIKNLENEINDLEQQLTNEQKINKQRKIIRTIKISMATIRRLAPYSLILVLSTTGWKTITGSYPFIRDNNNKVPKKIMREIDNYGNIKEQGQYKGFEDKQNLVKYYTNWEKASDGFYTREVSTYILKDISDTRIENILTKKENIQDKYKPLSIIEEKQNNIENQEKNNEELIVIRTYTEDENDYILKKESIIGNFFTTLGYIFFIIYIEAGACVIRAKFFEFNYNEKVNEIKRKYPLINKEQLTKKLELKKDNYNRLTEE